MRLVLEWVYAGNYGIYSSLEKVREEGERLTEKIEVGKAHSKQRAVYAMARRRVCLQNGVAGTQEAWEGRREVLEGQEAHGPGVQRGGLFSPF